MARSALDEMSDSGAFNRSPSTFRNFISRDQASQFPAESGRYHLYISYACPWASRCLAFLNIKGLEKAISFTVKFFPFFHCQSVSLYNVLYPPVDNCFLLCLSMHFTVCEAHMGKNKGD